jgi:hypothetical protein
MSNLTDVVDDVWHVVLPDGRTVRQYFETKQAEQEIKRQKLLLLAPAVLRSKMLRQTVSVRDYQLVMRAHGITKLPMVQKEQLAHLPDGMVADLYLFGMVSLSDYTDYVTRDRDYLTEN